MHIGNETKAALAMRPETTGELLRHLPDEFVRVPINGDEKALAEVDGAERAIIERWGMGADLIDPMDAPHWRISWYADWWMLEGLIALREGERGAYDPPHALDAASPLVLLHRQRNAVYYGDELVPLAARVIAHSLAYNALTA